MCIRSTTCDTLRNDEDTGDECLDCGEVYADLARSRRGTHTVIVATTRSDAIPLVPTSRSGVSRGVRAHSFNFGPTGGRGLAFRGGVR